MIHLYRCINRHPAIVTLGRASSYVLIDLDNNTRSGEFAELADLSYDHTWVFYGLESTYTTHKDRELVDLGPIRSPWDLFTSQYPELFV